MEESQYNCERCGKQCKSKLALMTHLYMKRKCLPIQSNISVDELIKQHSDGVEQICEFCGVHTSNKYTLAKHKKRKTCQSIQQGGSSSTSITGVGNTMIAGSSNTVNTTNVVINVFGREDLRFFMDHPQFEQLMSKRLTSKDQLNELAEQIRLIYFNSEHPENRTVLKPDKESNTMLCYAGERNDYLYYREVDVNKVASDIIFKVAQGYDEYIAVSCPNDDIEMSDLDHFMTTIGAYTPSTQFSTKDGKTLPSKRGTQEGKEALVRCISDIVYEEGREFYEQNKDRIRILSPKQS